MSTLETSVRLAYLAAAALFVIGLHLMNSPPTTRRGNQLSMAGMAVAIVATLVLIIDTGTVTAFGWLVIGTGGALGAALGLYSARTVKMTAMPQLVSLFNAVGGGAAALVGGYDVLRLAGAFGDAEHAGGIPVSIALPAVLDVLIGAVTFSGSLIASGKLQGIVNSAPVVFPGARVLNAALAALMLGSGGYLATGRGGVLALALLAASALAFGVTMVLPIGGADMPVVVSMLNAFTGTAVAMAGFVVNNTGLIIAGALVGASGGILTKLMADAMNRSLANIIVGGFGTGDTASAVGAGGASVRELSADDAGIQLAYANKVIIVPGYGLAAAQAQHAAQELAQLLISRGVEVTFAIHPVAGRMPGHMNVLLAEANVSYELMKEMEEVNPEFTRTDVALVVGANDVTNPAARRPGSAISGMPILDVDRAAHVIVIKRSMGHGYAGIENELYFDPKTGMFFSDAKAGLTALAAAVKTLVG